MEHWKLKRWWWWWRCLLTFVCHVTDLPGFDAERAALKNSASRRHTSVTSLVASSRYVTFLLTLLVASYVAHVTRIIASFTTFVMQHLTSFTKSVSALWLTFVTTLFFITVTNDVIAMSLLLTSLTNLIKIHNSHVTSLAQFMTSLSVTSWTRCMASFPVTSFTPTLLLVASLAQSMTLSASYFQSIAQTLMALLSTSSSVVQAAVSSQFSSRVIAPNECHRWRHRDTLTSWRHHRHDTSWHRPIRKIIIIFTTSARACNARYIAFMIEVSAVRLLHVVRVAINKG